MLFNSLEFILLFLPLSLAGYFLLACWHFELATAWVAAASVFFYAWWDVSYIILLLGSISFNYLLGTRMAQSHKKVRRILLIIGICGNLCLLGYYKYADFFLSSINTLTGTDFLLLKIALPIGISFFTFTQLAFLVDVYKGLAHEFHFIRYLLFVTYFPHLVAGPILHHAEMMPQFARRSTYNPNWSNFAVGIAFFVVGLAKKVLIADQIAPFANIVFDSSTPPHLIEAWGAALAYTFQLYFDFSGYSDMAVGLSWLFGVRLPYNFNSPYKSANITEFWRRWHMTLSRFLRDYLYIPLGGNHYGSINRYRNLIITMLLGGLWHGASWTFVFWGLLHGLYLCINHGWIALRDRYLRHLKLDDRRSYRIAAQTLCFVAVVVAWVFFRAENFERAWSIIQGMVGINGVGLPGFMVERFSLGDFGIIAGTGRFEWPAQVMWLLLSAILIFLCPNSNELCLPQTDGSIFQRRLNQFIVCWPMSLAATLAGIFVMAILYSSRPSPFLYFQF